MKLFIDTAAIDEIREANAMGVLDGVTTNPSLVAKTGKDFKTVVKEILKEIPDRPVSGLPLRVRWTRKRAWEDGCPLGHPSLQAGTSPCLSTDPMRIQRKALPTASRSYAVLMS